MFDTRQFSTLFPFMAEKDWISRYFAPLATAGARNMNDDVGLLRASIAWQVVTTDALVEGVHFLKDQSLGAAARKLVRVNVSDLLAKGALPAEATLTLGWPRQKSEDDLREFAKGLSQELEAWNIGLVGGDTVLSPTLFMSLNMIGHPAVEERDPIWQDGSEPGHKILVTGKIGGNIGLADAIAGRDTSAAAHYFEPQIPSAESAKFVARYASASTDISDGLLVDLSQVLDASGVGAQISIDRVPFWRESSLVRELLDQCVGGDDYQIVCTAEPINAVLLIETGLFVEIGDVTTQRGLCLSHNNKNINLPETLGFEHGE